MKAIVIALVCAGLAACVAPPESYGPGSGYVMPDVKPDTETQARARVFTELAAGYYTRGQFKIVLQELRKAIQADPGFAPAYNLYGLVYMELAENALAEEHFKRSIALDRSNSEVRNNYGWFLCKQGRHDDGLAEFAIAVRNPLYDKVEQAMTNIGQCAEMKGDLQLAEANYQKALKLTPDNPAPMLKLAGLRLKQTRLDEAQRLLERHDKLARPSAESLWLGLRIERRSGDAAQEESYAQQLRKLFPDSDEARRLLAGNYE